MYFVGFPAILKGWIERVFSFDFAFGLSPDGRVAYLERAYTLGREF